MSMLQFDGKKLKELRRQRGLTQAEIAILVGKTSADIANYENGWAKPSADTLLSLQKVLSAKYSALSAEPA